MSTEPGAAHWHNFVRRCLRLKNIKHFLFRDELGEFHMIEFKVRLYNMAIWDGREPRTVVAPSAKEAAQQTSGERLKNAGTIGNLRAEVWAIGKPQEKETYYSIL